MVEKMARENRCIICGNNRDGLEVRDDFMIKIVRLFKRHVTRNEKGYRLTVCRDCYDKYKKLYDSFARKRALYIALGVVFAIVLAIVGGWKAIPVGIVVIAIMYLVALLSYAPAVKLPEARAKAAATPARRKRKRG